MTLVVAGDVDIRSALQAKLDAALGAWKPTGAKKPRGPSQRPRSSTKRLLLVDRPGAAQSDVRDRRSSVSIARTERYFAFEVLTDTLGGGFTSRLVQRLREQLGITYGAHAGMDWRLAPGPFVISSAIVTPSTGQGIGEMLKILDDLAATDLPAEELEKSKQNLIRALPSQFETNAATAGAFAELALHGLPDDWLRALRRRHPQGHREGRQDGREDDRRREARWSSASSATWQGPRGPRQARPRRGRDARPLRPARRALIAGGVLAVAVADLIDAPHGRAKLRTE